MKILVTFLASIYSRFFMFFGRYVGGKLLIVGAGVTAFLVLLAGLNSVFISALASIAMTMPVEFQWGLGFIPSNVPICISALLTMRAALWLFAVKWEVIKIKMSV